MFIKGKNLAIIPGGFEEATLMEYGVERVVLKARKGFIKYALRCVGWHSWADWSTCYDLDWKEPEK